MQGNESPNGMYTKSWFSGIIRKSCRPPQAMLGVIVTIKGGPELSRALNVNYAGSLKHVVIVIPDR